MNKIKFVALGGQDERGKNCYLIEYNDNIFVFNAGVKMPINGALGINMIVANFDYLLKRKNKIKGIFVGTANFFNTGGLQFLLQTLASDDIPIYTSKIGKAIIDTYFDKKVKNKKELCCATVALEDLETISFDDISFTPFRVSNHLPDSFGWAIKTELGAIVFIDEFYVNNNKTQEFASQLNELHQIIEDLPVISLIVGMGNVGKFGGFTSPNNNINGFYEGIVSSNQGRIFVALNDFNVYSILVLAKIAREKSRPFIIYGSTFINTFNAIIREKMFISKGLITAPISEINNLQNAIVIFSDTEEDLYKKLFSMANNQISSITLKPFDTFVLGTHLVPGYESHAARLLDELSRQELNIYTLPKTIQPCSASNEDHQFLVDLIKPQTIIPIEGYFMNYLKYKNLISDFIKPEDIIFIDNGEAIEFTKHDYSIQKGHIDNLTNKFVTLNGVIDNQLSVLQERKQMSVSGIIVANFHLNKENQEFYNSFDVKTIGLVINEKQNYLLDVLTEKMETIITKSIAYTNDNKIDLATTKNNLKKNLLRFFEKKTNKKPLILTNIIEI